MIIDECDKDQHQTETSIQPGKDGTIWKNQKERKKCENKKSIQNISSVAPGPTKFSKERVHNTFDAFKILIDSTVIHWIVNFTEIEANR